MITIKFDKYFKIYAQGLDATITEFGVTQGIMMFVAAAVMIAVMIPVLNGVMVGTPRYVTNPLDVGNLSGGGGVLASASMNATQTNMYSMIGSSFSLMVVVLIIVAAAVIIGAIGLFKMYGGGGE